MKNKNFLAVACAALILILFFALPFYTVTATISGQTQSENMPLDAMFEGSFLVVLVPICALLMVLAALFFPKKLALSIGAAGTVVIVFFTFFGSTIFPDMDYLKQAARMMGGSASMIGIGGILCTILSIAYCALTFFLTKEDAPKQKAPAYAYGNNYGQQYGNQQYRTQNGYQNQYGNQGYQNQYRPQNGYQNQYGNQGYQNQYRPQNGYQNQYGNQGYQNQYRPQNGYQNQYGNQGYQNYQQPQYQAPQGYPQQNMNQPQAPAAQAQPEQAPAQE